MTRHRFYFLTTLFIFQTVLALGQDTKIAIPDFNDKYSSYVKQLESGMTDIDYVDFRNSFLESNQFSKKGSNYDSLKKQVYTEIKNKNYTGVLQLTKAMLSN